VLGFVVLRVLDETPADARWLTDPEKSALISRLQQESAPAAGRADGVSDALRHPWIWVLALVYFVVPVALYGFGFFLPQILRSTFAGTPFQIGALSAIPYLAGAAGMIVTSRHSDRTGERRWHVAVAATLAGVAFMATAFVEGLAPSLVLLSIAMLGLASMFGPFWTLATSFVQGPGAAAGIALINSVGNVGGFVGPYGIGYLRDTTSGYSAGLMGIGAVVLAGGALVLLVPDRSRRSG